VSRALALGVLLLTNAVWGTSYAVAKVALAEIPAPLLGALRITIASTVLWAVLLTLARRDRPVALEPPPLPPARDALRLAGLGLLGVSANALLGTWGISLTTATDASLMIVGEVIFTVLLAALLAGERLGRRRGLGIGVGIVGVVVLVGGSAGPADELVTAGARAAGNLLILTGLFFESAYSVLGAKLARAYRPLAVLALSFGGSLLVWLPLLAAYGSAGRLAGISLAAWGGVLYLALITSAAGYLIWFAVLRHAGASLGAISLLAQPLVGATVGIGLLGDPAGPATVLGGSLIVACLVLTALPEKAVD
jgi:drug/metabolite transporter (DMT)-like permease